MIENYVAIDLEMTGLQAKTDRILEMAAVRVRNGREEAVFSVLVNPQVRLKEKITELTGITQQEADAGAPLDETAAAFLDFLGEDVLIGHNILFDYSFLKQWAVNHKIALEKRAVDTLKLARLFLPQEQKKDLESLCTYFEIERGHGHRALEDTRETVRVFEKIKEIYGREQPEAFEPKALLYKAKKQSPVTLQQIRYLKRFADFHKISLPENVETLTKSEASRLTDRLIAVYGKMTEAE